jgi:hypothetical protein
MKVPILFVIFNRPDIAAKSFESIRIYQPDKLYIAADGPRKDRLKEDELCSKTRKTILDMVDWKCDVKTLFRKENVGVDFGVYGAISWFFETEPWGIIIEDDCIVSQDFFLLCEIAFPKYKDVPKVMNISSNNMTSKLMESNNLKFSYYPMTWGWGTWADRWHEFMDPQMKKFRYSCWSSLLWKYGIIGIFFYRSWRATYKVRETLNPWDTIWNYSVLTNDGLSLMADVNLSYNNGIGTSDGAHFKQGDENFYQDMPVGHLIQPYNFPVTYDSTKIVRKEYEHYYLKLRWFGLKKKIRKLFRLG